MNAQLHPMIPDFRADILIVDDTPDNIRFLATLLTDQGYNVRKALNGAMGLTAVRAAKPDLILLDITMPGMNGYDVCRQLKADPQTAGIPVIFLSALDDVVDKVKGFQLGAIDYITKPFQFEEVLARIRTQLTLRMLQAQLQQQNQQLQQALLDLGKAQAELVQQEKMVGLGQLVAGITHELNNPVNFISGNLKPAREYMQSLLSLIQLYQQEYPEPTAPIQDAIDDIDLQYVETDLPRLIESMQTGADRIRAIVLALRIFSRLGEAEIKSVNLHEGLESTLLLLQHRLKATATRPEITINRHYGHLPPVTCYASQLNQVFLNLLTNAIDALDEASAAGTAHPPTITIATEPTLDDRVIIRVRDNGIGIPAENQSRVFDPFFTTKPVGQAVGLGLATSYQIVARHSGQLTCSGLTTGAEFTIDVPVQLPVPADRSNPNS